MPAKRRVCELLINTNSMGNYFSTRFLARDKTKEPEAVSGIWDSKITVAPGGQGQYDQIIIKDGDQQKVLEVGPRSGDGFKQKLISLADSGTTFATMVEKAQKLSENELYNFAPEQ